ncbi:hypothetical protein [Prochlorococcus marinus]|uniref:hypothetical protein n=1 Tax=Prochlorococcus marinus TaxID=1219 RepID=UPI0039AF5F31
MKYLLPRHEIFAILSKQLRNQFLLVSEDLPFLEVAFDQALIRCNRCFSRCRNKYYQDSDGVVFNPFHSGQYTIFLYWLARSLYEEYGDSARSLCDRVYFLNRVLNSVDLYYEVKMPEFFFLEHPLGSVLGRATYGDGFAFSQQCNVGGNHNLYPRLGSNVILFTGSKILGNCSIGSNVLISANTLVMDIDIPDFSLVFGRPRDYVIKPVSESYVEDFLQFDL